MHLRNFPRCIFISLIILSISLDEWERMTRKLPDDVLQRTPEESKRNKERNMKDLRKKLRDGHNNNTTEAQTAKTNTQQNEANKKEFDANLIYKNKKNNNSL